MRILLFEDEVKVGNALSEGLREEGYEVAWSQTGEDGFFQASSCSLGSFQNLDLSVRFKAVSGSVDRAGGLVFRLNDPNNYYIVRANALENNYRLDRVVNGRRGQFAGADFKVTSGDWLELRVEAIGNKISCYYDSSKKMEATDETLKEAGKIGLWTKADSRTSFDDLEVTSK